MLDVYEGIDAIGDCPTSLFTQEDTDKKDVGDTAPSATEIEQVRARNSYRKELVGPNVLKLCKLADVVFLALHGDMGENGQIQALLDVFNIAYTGSGYDGSCLAMNKDISKKLMRQSGILTPDWIKYDMSASIEDEAKKIVERVGFPCIVKPCSCGSSVGVSMVSDLSKLKAALKIAADYESSVLIEKRILGREITQAFFDGKALPPVEIIPKTGFYDYKNKYVENATTEICPAPISEGLLGRLSEITKACFDSLLLSDYARVDYIVDEEENVWCLEANTLPGMTPTSLFPQEAAAVGIGYDELCERIAMTALKK